MFSDDFNTDRHLRYIILSCLENEIGDLWKLQVGENSYALMLVTKYFSAFAGDSCRSLDLYEPLIDKAKRHTMLLVDDLKWIDHLKSHFGFKFVHRKNMRYSFDEANLKKEYLVQLKCDYISKYDYSDFDIRSIKETDAEKISEYMIGHFEIFADRETLAGSKLCHVAVSTSGEVVSIAAAAHSPISGHYEVQIVTEPEYRKRGLSMIVTIEHLIYALDQQHHPHWDAATKISAGIAEKLGYGEPEPYDGYFFTTIPIQILRKSKIPKVIIWFLRKIGKLKD